MTRACGDDDRDLQRCPHPPVWEADLEPRVA
jgi:hypothetical protein